jgi:hypothetical protein
MLLVACAVLPFLPAVSSEFVLEDRDLITSHPVVTGQLPAEAAFTTGFYGKPPPGEAPGPYYRPLAILLLRVETLFFGQALVPRHLVNLALHAGNAVLLWLLLRRRLDEGRALVGALLFAVHPVQTGAVAWVSGRTDVLATLFALLCLVSPKPVPRASAFFAALLAKETAVVVPLVALVLDQGTWHQRLRQQVPFVLAAVAYALLRSMCFSPFLPADGPPAARVLPFAPSLLGLYLRHLVVPFPPHWQRAVPLELSPLAFQFVPGLLLLAAAAAAAWCMRSARPALIWTVAWLLPVCGLLPLAPWQPDAWILSPRFLYFGVGGFALLLASRLPARVLAALLVPLAGLTAWHACDYRSTETLVRAGLRWDQDSAALWKIRADISHERWNETQDPAMKVALASESLAAIERAVALRPKWYEARRSLALLLAAAGLTLRSEQLHRDLIRENLRDPMAPSNLAVVLATQGRLGEARQLWQEALRRQPDFTPARANLDRLDRGR